jgi:hypothetical protein
MSTNVYKRFDPRVMEREERIGINRGLPTMNKLKTRKNQVDSLFLYSTTLHPHIFMGASITDRTIFTSDTKEFHFHKRDFDWLIRNFEQG